MTLSFFLRKFLGKGFYTYDSWIDNYLNTRAIFTIYGKKGGAQFGGLPLYYGDCVCFHQWHDEFSFN